jgi:hypothetical protein
MRLEKSKRLIWFILVVALLGFFYPALRETELASCIAYAGAGFRPIANERGARFLGKVSAETARCRGGEAAVRWRQTPWVDWQTYRGTGDQLSAALTNWLGPFAPDARGLRGALLDFEYQRIELLKFNLFDNSGTYPSYVRARARGGRLGGTWAQFRLPASHPLYKSVGGSGEQRCDGEIIRFRTVDGICSDMSNPLMGASGQNFARNVDFAAAFPEQSLDASARNRHANRIALLKPDPQLISRRLFARPQSVPQRCNGGQGLPGHSAAAHCDYQKAPHLNVLAAFWIQFMTHDWFSHLSEGANAPQLMPMGCAAEQVNGTPGGRPGGVPSKNIACRPGDRIDEALFSEQGAPETFAEKDRQYFARAYKTSANNVTAWWDASQVYGYDARSRRRVKRDPRDRAKLLLESAPGQRELTGYLPLLESSDYRNPQWHGQESVAFPDNWNIGLSFFHNVFAREHNLFVDHFRARTKRAPETDSGLRHPTRRNQIIPYKDVTDDELFEVARLVIAAEIAKIHTIEWTPQLLYNEPLHLAMNANWSGLLEKHALAGAALESALKQFAEASQPDWFAAFAAGPGIVGLGNKLADFNAGIHHFGSPFNFPEEFVNAYRLHAMLPDLLEYREHEAGSNRILEKIPVTETLRGRATSALRRRGLAHWALSLGRQRAAQLTLKNHPLFLYNLKVPRISSTTGKIDVLALDIIRDRERGIPRYNEFRRQYGLRQLTSFDDFIDPRLPQSSPQRSEQRKIVAELRQIYGQHRCDAAKIISQAQTNDDGSGVSDCLGHAHGSLVDNIEDLDALVGWLAESVRPHGFAISETQFQVFMLNASRRLFSDRFFTSSFRAEFYSHPGIEWVNHNGPDGKIMEKTKSNGHRLEVSPLKRVLQRTIPELRSELENVINVFDPWARDRGQYYSLQWKPRPAAETDPAFSER